jgi:hypothetical protein
MDVWILEVDIPNEYDTSISIWDSEDEALKQACSEIQEEIMMRFDLPNMSANDRDVAKDINEHVAAGRWERAIECWNESDINRYAKSPIYWTVRSQRIRFRASEPLVRPVTDFDDSEYGCPHEGCDGCDHIDCIGGDKFYQ